MKPVLAFALGCVAAPFAAAPSCAQQAVDPIAAWFDGWSARVASARGAQPGWSSPVVTTTALLEQRARFDTSFQRAGNGANTISVDGGKGLDLIVGDTEEVQIASDPYVIRTNRNGRGQLAGFNDWPFIRFKQRLASSPEAEDDYVVSAWLQLQAPTGIKALSTRAGTLLPTIGFGKGFGPFVVQATFGAAIPTAYETTVGTTLVGNAALQFHLLRYLWPQIEANWTKYLDGRRGGKDQVFLTPGLVVGRLQLGSGLGFTIGAGYQTAVAPKFKASPLLPSYDHAWVVTTRLSF